MTHTLRYVFAFVVLTAALACQKKWHVADTKTTYYRFDKKTDDQSDQSIEAVIAPFRQTLDDQMGVVIGRVATDMYKSKPSSALGNWVADLLHDEAEARSGQLVDFAVQNYGGLRIPGIAQGQLKIGTIYELMPFDNQLVIVRMDGGALMQLLQRMADYGGWPVSRGLQFRIENGQPFDIRIKGEPYAADRTYAVAMPDYIANGGDACFFLEDQPKDELNALIRDVIIEHVRQVTASGQVISAKTDQRITEN